jgi:DNA-binding transcriptional MerR regulator
MVTEQPIALTLEELTAEVASLLEEYSLLGAAHDNRVSAVPDMRTIRYYTTLGLIDRPVMDGRQARYGKRHLLQILAIKSLQSAGLPLAEIQERIYGRSDRELELLLGSLSGGRKEQPAAIKTVVWREVIVEPGFKILLEEGWEPRESLSATTQKINAILAALQSS